MGALHKMPLLIFQCLAATAYLLSALLQHEDPHVREQLRGIVPKNHDGYSILCYLNRLSYFLFSKVTWFLLQN